VNGKFGQEQYSKVKIIARKDMLRQAMCVTNSINFGDL